MNAFLPTKRRTSSSKKTFSASFLRMAYGSIFALLLLMSGGVFGQTTVTHTIGGTTGVLDSNISFSSQQNSGTNAPFYSSSQIRLYWSSSDTSTRNGCSITITPSNGAVISQVKVIAVSSYTTTVKYNVDGAADATASLSGTTYTISSLSCSSSIKIRNANTSNVQLRIASLEVTYTLPPSGFTVTFNNNGGSGTMTPQTASGSTALTTNTFTKANNVFAGWNTAIDGSGIAYADGASFPFTADATLYAQWTPVTTTLADNGSAIGAGNITQGTNNNIIASFTLAQTGANGTLNAVTVPTTGTYVAADINGSGFKLWYTTTNTFATTNELRAVGSTSTGTGETLTFSGLAQPLTSGATGYFWITSNIIVTATPGNTLIAGALGTSNITVASGTKSGSSSASGTKTIIATAVPTISVTPATLAAFDGVCLNTDSTPKSYDVVGVNLTTDVIVTAPAGFKVRKLAEAYSSSTNLVPDGSGNVNTTIDVIYSPTVVGASGTLTITHASTGAVTKNVSVSGTGTGGTVAVTTVVATAITTTTAASGGSAVSTSCGTITANGVVWGTSANPTVPSANSTSDSTVSAGYSSAITGLTENTLYHYRAYATNSNSVTGYGAGNTFTSVSKAPTTATASTATANGFTASWTAPASQGSATLTYTIKIYSNNTFTTQVGTDITGITGTSTVVPGLTSSTTYYYTVAAVNAGGTSAVAGYTTGITTLNGPCLSEDFVNFSNWTASNPNTSTTGSQVGLAIPAKTLAVSSNIVSPVLNNPMSLSFFQDSSSGGNGSIATISYKIGSGEWTQFHSFVVSTNGGTVVVDLTNLSGVDLSAYTNVQLRFESSFNTWYLDDVEVYCGIPCVAPTVTLQGTPVTSIATTTATLNGNVTAQGDFAINTRGFEYSVNSNMTASATTSTATTATGTYSENLTGLVANTVYYYRGYAVNDCTPNKTGYTATSSTPFTTLHNAPTVGIGTGATSSSFTAQWTAPAAGGPAAFTYQIEVDDDSNFGTVNFTTNGISGLSTLVNSGLQASTTYYYRVRAVNAAGNSAWSATSVGYATTAPTPEINIKQGSTTIASTNTYTFTNQVSGTTGSSITFTIENTGNAPLSVGLLSKSGTDAALFTITQPLSSSVAAGGTTTFTVVFSPTSLGAKTAQLSLANGDDNENPYIINLSGTGTRSTESVVKVDPSYSGSSAINYLNYLGSNITETNSYEIGRFIIYDGNGTTPDADNLATILNSITFNVSGSASLSKIALYDGTTELSEIAGNTPASFSSLNVIIPEGASKVLSIRALFNTSSITDKQLVRFSLFNPTANASGSGFGSSGSQQTPDQNIEVTANGLGFITQPTSTAINVAMATVVVAATDSNANVDVDFTGPVSIFSTGTLTGSPVMGTLVAGVASFSTLTHTAVATGRMLFVSSSGLITGGSSLFDITEIVYVTGDYRTIGTGNWLSNNASPAIWQRLDAVGNWNPSNSPSYNTTNNVYIRDTHTITATGSFGNGVKLKIMDGGTFDMTSSGTVASIYVYNGGELRVNGALTVVGTFDVENGADVYINAPSANIWGGTENFRPLSNFYIWNWNSAQYLYNNNINPNSSGSIFGNLYIDTLGASGLSDTWNLLGQNTGTIALTSGDLAFNSGQNNIRFFAETGSTANVTVKGNLKLNSGWTSGRTLALSTAGTMNLTVEGNVEIDCPGDLAIKQSNAPASAATLNINGNLVMNGSNTTATTNLHLNFANSGTGGGGKAIVNLKGNLLSNSNASITNSVSTADVEFNFNGISTQLVNMSAAISGSDADNTRGIPLYVKPNAIVQLNSNDLILANGSSLTVETGGTLDFGFNGSTALIIKQGQTGNSAFTSQTESNLKITSPAGIASSGATGNVQTSSRTFGAADYRYVGIANQITGTGLPTSGAKITSANIGTAPTNEVLLTNSPTSVTALDVVSGKFNLNEKTLTGTNLSIANDATLKIVGTATFPTFTSKIFATNSIVEYGGANQVIAALTAPTYAKLKVSGTGIKTLETADVEIGNTLEVTASLLKIEEGKTLSVTNEITTVNTNVVPKTDNNVYVAPTLGITIDDGGSLIQKAVVNNQSGNLNTGKINMERLTQKMYRLDYTYWSSPVGDGFTLHDLSPNTLASKYFQWNPGPVPAGNWGVITGGNSAMVPGKGYIIRAPNSYSIDASNPASYQKFTGNFIGKPNNGTISIPVSGSDTVNVWNLLGNPYPSALNADLFLDANIGISDSDTNNAVVGGTLYFWTHNTPFASTTTFNYSASDYASWNGVGSTTTAAAASTPNGNANLGAPNGKIAAGQAFFIKGTANGNAVFNNDMRVKGENMQFFRPSAVNNSNYALTTGKHRIWLNLEGATQGFSQTLVGYVTNATNDYDIRFDGESFGGNVVTFYSVNNDKNLVIQGRALPFVDTDEVPMGYKTTLTGNLTISIDHKDGLFDNQLVYLKDNVLNVVHNLSTSAYTFAAVPGTFNDRFVLRYLPAEDLANPTFEEQISNVTIRKNDTTLRVNSPYETIDEVLVYDIMGRLLFDKKDCNTNTFETNTILNGEQTLIVKVRLTNGGVVTKKVL